MAKREQVVWVLLCATLLAALAIPAKGLFVDGVYSWHIRQPEFWDMVLEIAGLALILGAVWFFMSGYPAKLIMTGMVCTVFVWCHVVFLPMVVSGIYVLYLYLAGYTIRRRLFKDNTDLRDSWSWDFLLGCSAVITLFCLMSAAGAGSIPALKTAAAGAAVPAVVGSGKETVRRFRNIPAALDGHRLTKIQSLTIVFMILMVLIQIGRMNISLDFDSLWYGVRSEFILDNGHGIYENMGSVGLVYTYSKGLEVLLLPISDLASHSYLMFFNIWMAVASLAAVYRIGRFFMGRTYACLAAACVSSIPAVMNMSITAKTDSMTLMVQLVMVMYLLHYLQKKQVNYLIASLGALFFSWMLKPTALVFSTAVYGMSMLYLLVTSQFSWKATLREWTGILLPAAALAAIWARTMIIVGIPVTSVFSSVFLKLGFTLKYPFSVLPLYGGGERGNHILSYMADTLYRMFLDPAGENMSHVVIAWGTSLLFLLTIVFLSVMLVPRRACGSSRNLAGYARTVMIPYVLVCLASLAMLGQIDGNYFMLLDVGIVLCGCTAVSHVRNGFLQKSILVMMIPVILFNVPVTMVSNWAWSLGFTPVSVVNSGRMNHREQQRGEMEDLGNAEIWETLAADPQNRVIAAGSHPQVFNFPCNVQSYDDITSTWGNVLLVKTMDHFVRYLEYAKTDYVYMQAGYADKESRCYELMGYLIEAGILTEVVYEAGNLLAEVDLQGSYGAEASDAYEMYRTGYQVKGDE